MVSENDKGVVISGMKMLATSAIFANEIWIGNLIPLAPDQVKQSITCDTVIQMDYPLDETTSFKSL